MTSEEAINEISKIIFRSTDLFPEVARDVAEEIYNMLEEKGLLR